MALINKKAWSATGRISTATNQLAVQAQANFSNEPGIYTIQFDLKANPVLKFNAVAEIVWSVEGNESRRLVSVTPGLTVSGSGQAVRVKIYDTLNNNLGGGAAQTYVASCLITKGLRPDVGTPVIYADSNMSIGVAANNNALIQVPFGIGIRSIITTAKQWDPAVAIIDSDVKVTQFSALGNISYDPRVGLRPAIPGLNTIEFQNNNAGTIIIFGLLYGIDG